jgi:hypothetical protein
MKETATAIEFVSEYKFMGTIEKLETFNSKGGGLALKVQTGETDKAVDILTSKGNVLEFTVRVSKQRAASASGDDDDDQGELDLSDSIPEPQGDD